VRQVRAVRLLKRSAYATAAVFIAIAGLYAQASTTPPAGPSREITDEIGRSIRIPQSVHRIVSLAPSLTETIYALGLEDRLVGDTDYCDFPPEAQKKTKVGGAINPSIETIASLHPDLVLVTKSLNRIDTVHALENLGIPSYATDPHTVNGILSSTQRLAQVLGAPDSGTVLTNDLEHRLAEIQQRIASRPPRRVLFIVWIEPLISIGKDTFIADAIQHAGGVSVVNSPQSWPQVNLEEIVRLQPEFLVFAESHSQTSVYGIDALGYLPGWRILDAVRNRRYARISDAVNRPGPRIVSAIEDLARQLHPEAFGERHQGGNENTAQPNAVPPGSSFRGIHAQQAASRECACAR
jgi:iron complex transport system substrate-binding protein